MENNSLNHLDALKNLMSDSAEPVPNQKVLSKIQPADVAGLLDELSSHQKHVLWKLLGSKRTARVLAEADETEIKAFLKQTSIEALAEVIAAMPTDEAADLLEYAGTKVVESVLALQSVKHATNIRRLRKYQTDTAGGIMTTEFFSAGASEAVEKILERLKEEQEGLETIEKIFVVDIDLKLKGTVTIGAVIGADKETLAQDLMETSVLTVSVYVDQEVCARLMEKYNLTVLPVVDQHQHMLGIITADDILKVLGDEATEDLFRLAGIGESKPFEQSALLGVYRRLPWLLVTLTGVSLLGAVISRFQGTIERIVALSFFIPAVMGLGGNTGIQASTVTLRGLVTNRIELKHFGWILKRELSIAALIGIVCSLGLGALAYVMFTLTIQPETEPSVSAYQFAIMVGFAILCSVTFSSLIGTSIPMLCHRLRIDPAIAAGPFVTTLIDIISQVIYFGIATWILMK